MMLLMKTCHPVSLFLGDVAAHLWGVWGARSRPEGDSCASLVSLTHADGGERREVVLDGAVDEVTVAGIHRREQQCSGTRHSW